MTRTARQDARRSGKEDAEHSLSGYVLSKTAIFPKNEGRKGEISNESTRGLSLYEANVYVNPKGAPHDGQDTVKTLRTIIWYKRACIKQTTRRLSITVQTSKKDLNKSFIIGQFPN